MARLLLSTSTHLLRQTETPGPGSGPAGGVDPSHGRQNGGVTYPNVPHKTGNLSVTSQTPLKLSEREERISSSLINLLTLVCPFPFNFLDMAFSFFLSFLKQSNPGSRSSFWLLALIPLFCGPFL